MSYLDLIVTRKPWLRVNKQPIRWFRHANQWLRNIPKPSAFGTRLWIEENDRPDIWSPALNERKYWAFGYCWDRWRKGHPEEEE